MPFAHPMSQSLMHRFLCTFSFQLYTLFCDVLFLNFHLSLSFILTLHLFDYFLIHYVNMSINILNSFIFSLQGFAAGYDSLVLDPSLRVRTHTIRTYVFHALLCILYNAYKIEGTG